MRKNQGQESKAFSLHSQGSVAHSPPYRPGSESSSGRNWREESNQGEVLQPTVSVIQGCRAGLGVGEEVGQRVTE